MTTTNINRAGVLRADELAANPRERELSDDELAGVAGGTVSIEYLFLGMLLALGL